MKDKLTKKPRKKWIKFILSDPSLCREFVQWKCDHKYKIKSENKLAYIFLRSKYGLDWISIMRQNNYSYDEIERIAKKEWIKEID